MRRHLDAVIGIQALGLRFSWLSGLLYQQPAIWPSTQQE
jgi:hypothetical protein